MKLAVLILVASLSFAASPTRQFVVVSDIHFNPLADPAVVPDLQAAESSQWEEIFAKHSISVVQKYGDDSTWPLLAAMVRGIQNVQPKPKIIILTGDIFVHKFQERFAAATKLDDPESFRLFARKTVEFVSFELGKAAAGVPVIYTVGNNDEECGDYALQPGGTFLRDAADSVRSLAHLSANDLPAWNSLGDYVTLNPLARHHRILAVNTSFWSRRYTNTCGSKEEDPGAGVLTWLSSQLEDARKAGDKVWLIYHIPPGIDGHASSRTNQVVPLWKQPYADSFYKLLDKYRKTIELSLAGHTHLDDIRLVKTEHATTLVFVNPGLSPNVGQNPAFRVVTVDANARLQDIETFVMPNLQTLEWKSEYSARKTYGLKKINAKSYQALYAQIDRTTASGDAWRLNYSVSRPAGLSSNKEYQRSLYCAAGHITAESFQACLTAAR